MRNQVFKKLFSVLLALIMVAGLLPASAMAGGWGAMDVDTTPVPTEAVQPTESAEPTAPTETETPEVTEVPEPTPENPAATVEPAAEPTPAADPTEGITIAPVNEVAVQAANTETDTPFTINETKAETRTSVGDVNYRAVMLDCGRKYFSVENIEKLIDTMAQYGYNQLQLSFGNGGCRFLLDDMKLVFTDASGATVTLDSDDVENGIEAGNRAFNGDESVLTEAEMTEIISYANSKKIAIVPMLNMPGHMNWLEISFSEYTNGTKLERLDITNTTARNFGYALLNKYVSYFKKQGCEYFSFGADESGYTGDNMTKFLTGCANVIVNASMIPRAFNDATKAANMPKSVQITYWWIAEYTGHSSNATDLNTKGYELLNTHGNWYYVVNDGPAVSGKTVEYANDVTVELPMLKKDGSYKHTWPSNTNEFYDNSYSHGSQVIANKGTMFCIWCDNSTGMPAEDIISTEKYGALTQLQELAKLYWGDELNQGTTPIIKMDDNTDIPASIKVGESITLKADKEVSWETTTSNLVEIAATRAVKGTTATITAKAAGDAVITATADDGGMTVINLKVTANGLENVEPLEVELWITNRYVGATQATATATGHFVRIAAKDAYVEDGITLASQVPSPAKDANDETDIFWKGVVLQNGEKQYVAGTEGKDSDKSGKGKDFTQVRYFNNEWQCYYDGNWNGVKEDDTIIAYYMQKFPVSPEINTTTRDFGSYAGENDTALPGWPGYIGYMATAFAVVYPGYTMSPKDDSAIYKETTMLRYATKTNLADKSLTPGIVYAENNSEYEIEKITITRGKHTQNTATWTKNDDITWEKVENDAGKLWYKEEIIWEADNPAYGNIPYVNLDGSEWYAKKIGDSFLILIYLKVIPKETNLNVVYWDDNANKQINPNDIQIVVEENVTYRTPTKGLQNGNINVPNDESHFKLDEGAYIVNSSGQQQGFQRDITQISGVATGYQSGIYGYVDSHISADGKTLYLHYNLSSPSKTYVVDFGLPIVIKPTDIGIAVDKVNSIEDISLAATKGKHEGSGTYGNAVINTTDGTDKWNLTYTLKTMSFDTAAAIPLWLWFKDNYNEEADVKFTANIIPATNVYYEDSFAQFIGGAGAAASAQWEKVYDPGTDETTNPNANATQALEALGQTGHNPYGYDQKYDNCTMFSMGSAQKVTVTQDMAKDGVVWPTAQFTFKGTGFDIISLTDNTSGAIFVDVTRKVNGEEVKERSVFVDNYYGYSYENGTWKAEPNNPNAIYQVPVIKVSGLDYDEHKVVIKVAYNTFFDDANAGSYSFWLDAVRVYDPAGNTLDNDYVKDREVKPIYVEVRKALIKQGSFTGGNENIAGAVFIDGKADGATIDDYKNFGPNHEVYLAGNQAIAFRIVANREPATVQIGVKLANGSNGTLKIGGGNEVKFAAYSNVNASDTLTLSTATDMYYALDGITWTEKNSSQESNVIVLTNTGDNSIVSITNVKCTYASITENTTNAVTLAISYDDALMAVDAVNSAITPVEPEPEPEPEKTFEPERFEASWSRNVMQGRKATLTVKTSEDVEAITVDGQTIRSYRTRTERVGFGRRAKRITYREFTYSMVAQESADFSVTAINAEGTESEAITARLTVKTRPNSLRDMWDWFKGWF